MPPTLEDSEVAFGSTKNLLNLIETIYAAVQQPELWSSVLDGMSEAIHGESMTLFAHLPGENLVSRARIDPNAWDAYVNYYASINPLAAACDRHFADGEVRYGNRALPDVHLEKSEFYNDFFRPYRMHHSMGIKIPLSGNLPATYLSCQRPKQSGPFEEHEGRVYQTLLPHLQRALSLHIQMTQMQSHLLGIETALEAYEHAVIGLDRKGKVILASKEAESLLRTGDGIRASNGQLYLREIEENTRLQAAIRDVITSSFTVSAPAAILVPRLNGSPLQLTIVPHRSSLLGMEALAALVFLGDPSRRSASKAALLRVLYGLSPMEARIADLLGEGRSAREIADQLKIAYETARFHTKRVLAKTGSRRQAELMKLILALPNL